MRCIPSSLTVVLALAVCTASLAAQAPPTPRVRVGVFAGGGHAFQTGFEPFRQRLRQLGYMEGQDLALDVRNAEGRAERYPALAAELVRLKVDVIVVQGNAAVAALKQATQTIPIVMVNIGDPVGAGFVASLARPGGNITGLSNMAEGVSTKWVELLKEVAPRTTRIAVLWDPKNVAHTGLWREIQEASRALSVTPVAWEVRGADDIAHAFSAIVAEKVGAVIVLPHPPAGANLGQIAGLAIRHGLPATYLIREFALVGGLMSYGPSNADMWRQAAEYVDRIVKGAKPANLPVGQPTKFELVINRKTATAIGLTLPPSFLLRADEILQ
jgi:putative tryptophan/tyrosine transport system substrate-binding protein